jgi:hypothetical protein
VRHDAALDTRRCFIESTRFDTITRALAEPRSRRQALRGLIGATALAGGSLVGAGMAEAKQGGHGKGKKGGNGKGKKKGKEKVTLCQNGHTIRVARPAVPAHLKKGATEGACERA